MYLCLCSRRCYVQWGWHEQIKRKLTGSHLVLYYAYARNVETTGHRQPSSLVHIPSYVLCLFLPGGDSQKKLGGGLGPVPKTLTLFMTKICDIPYPIYDLTTNSKPY